MLQRPIKIIPKLAVASCGLALACAAPGLAAPASSGPTPEPAAESAHVHLDVYADHRSIGPGESVWVAIVQRIDPGWHTYWVNPGDAGVATKIQWTAPKGFTIGEPEWIVPRVFRSGPLVTYGYEGEAVSLQEFRAPAVLASGPVRLAFDVRWLVCHDICIPERGEGQIVIEQAAVQPGAADAALRPRFEAARRELPRATPWSTSLAVHPDSIELALHGAAHDLPPHSALRFLPFEWGEIDNAADQFSRWNGNDLVLTLDRGDLRDTPLAAIDGILIVEPAPSGGAPRGYRVHAVVANSSPPR